MDGRREWRTPKLSIPNISNHSDQESSRKRVLSTFPAIDTSVDGIKFSAGLEEMASVMHEGSLIRTFTLPIVDKITHAATSTIGTRAICRPSRLPHPTSAP